MSAINQENVYRGVIMNNVFTQSTGGFPQENLDLKAFEVYDSDSNSWLPADPDNNEITWYGVLIDSHDKETKNNKQLKKITGWDGADFMVLRDMDMADIPLQFTVKPNTYKDVTTLQVSWIDTVDAPLFRTVTKLDKNEVIALQQRYATVLSSTKAAVKPVSAPTKTSVKTPAKSKAPTKPKPPTKPAKPSVPKTAVVGKCTGDDAYNACYSLKKDDVTDEALNEIWLAEVAKVNLDESKITLEQWFVIKESVLRQTSKV